MAGEAWNGKLGDRFQVGEDLYVEFVEIAALKEQDVNAQVVQPRHMERLAENIRMRGALEQLPYCYRDPDGPANAAPEIVSGHHRTRAARQAGLQVIPVLVDERKHSRSLVTAKAIAHNEIHGTPDEQILRQLVGMIAASGSVDDLLVTGLPEEFVPTYGDDDTNLALPHVEFQWKLLTLLFLPARLEAFEQAIVMIDNATKVLGIAPVESFHEFAVQVHQHGRTHNVKNLAATVAAVTETARREVEEVLADGGMNTSWRRMASLVGTQLPAEAAETVRLALEGIAEAAELDPADPHRKWRALEFLAAEWLAGQRTVATREDAQQL